MASSIQTSGPSVPKTSMVLLSAVVGLFFTGCGQEDNGPSRFDVSGTVTHEGTPVPFGSIQFLPDSSKGTDGPMGYASIVDGKFNTADDGKGLVNEGAYTAVIVGYSTPPKEVAEANPDDEAVDDPALFPEFRTPVQLSPSQPLELVVPSVTISN